jgi:hypothetical protein
MEKGHLSEQKNFGGKKNLAKKIFSLAKTSLPPKIK